MMMEKKEVVGKSPLTQASGQNLTSPGVSKPVSEWEKLKRLIYKELGGKAIIVEKPNEIKVEVDGLKIIIEKDPEAHLYDYWTITVQTKYLDMFISTGLLQCFYNCELHQKTRIEIEERWNPEEDLVDNTQAEEAINTIKQIIQKYEKNYEEGLVAWFFNTYFPHFY